MKKIVTFGEIMLRLAPPGYQRFSQASSFDVIYGGGESNVAVSLANYGLPVEFVTRLSKNDIGACALMEMRKRNVGTTIEKVVRPLLPLFIAMIVALMIATYIPELSLWLPGHLDFRLEESRYSTTIKRQSV